MSCSADGRAIDAVLFDLDGTLLHTMPDLLATTNVLLGELGLPQRTYDEVRGFVGAGLRRLIARAVSAAPLDEAAVARLAATEETGCLYERWQQIHAQRADALTRPYEGVCEMLATLRARGAALAVVTNKPHDAALAVLGKCLPGAFDLICGEVPGMPRKPDPAPILRALDALGVPASRAAYVGDSPCDIEAALAAGTRAIGVCWGYRAPELLEQAGAHALARNPREVADVVERALYAARVEDAVLCGRHAVAQGRCVEGIGAAKDRVAQIRAGQQAEAGDSCGRNGAVCTTEG